MKLVSKHLMSTRPKSAGYSSPLTRDCDFKEVGRCGEDELFIFYFPYITMEE